MYIASHRLFHKSMIFVLMFIIRNAKNICSPITILYLLVLWNGTEIKRFVQNFLFNFCCPDYILNILHGSLDIISVFTVYKNIYKLRETKIVDKNMS